jgi:hypothetical protein
MWGEEDRRVIAAARHSIIREPKCAIAAAIRPLQRFFEVALFAAHPNHVERSALQCAPHHARPITVH